MNKQLKIYFTITLLSLCLINQSFAKGQQIKPLKIGDKVPDISFHLYEDGKYFNGKLSDYKGKFIILDFWATWCGSCIGGFPKIDSLQKSFKGELQVLLVNSEDSKELFLKFIKKRSDNGTGFPFITALNDTIAVDLFPHEYIPHYVWIDKEGKVAAITESKEVNKANVQQMLGERIELPLKRDFLPGMLNDLENNIPVDDNLFIHSFFRKGKIDASFDGKDFVVADREQPVASGGSNKRGLTLINVSLLKLYKTAAFYINPVLRSDNRRVILNVRDSSKLVYENRPAYKENWEKENLYSYENILPTTESDSACSYLLHDLNRYSNYYGRVELRKVKCIVIKSLIKVVTGKVEVSVADSYDRTNNGHEVIKNRPVYALLDALIRSPGILLPVIVENDSIKLVNVSVELNNDKPNISMINESLADFNIELVEEEREIQMFVITDKPG